MKNKNNKGQLWMGIIFVLLIIAFATVMFFLIKGWDSKKVPTTTTTIPTPPEPPVGNPTALPLVKVTDSNNQIIKPPVGGDALIMPEDNTTKPKPVPPTPVPVVNVTPNISVVPNITQNISVLQNMTRLNSTNITNTTR